MTEPRPKEVSPLDVPVANSAVQVLLDDIGLAFLDALEPVGDVKPVSNR